MSSVTVTTKQELKAAMKKKINEIIVIGDLADKLVRARKIARLSAASIALITTAVAGSAALAPVTGGASFGVGALGFAAVAKTTGTSVPMIIAAAAIGISLVVAVFKKYKVIEVKAGFLSLKLKD
ncbi:MAG: hypothetical protein ACOX9E_04340 [Lentisphaeria bacterium]|jgi:hypothetical protein